MTEPCDNCRTPLDESDYITEYEASDWGMGSAYEEIVTGYRCHTCDHREMF